MIQKDIQKITPQIPGESQASYNRLLIMLEQDIGTLEDLYSYLETEEPDKSVSLSTLQNCSSKDNWTERRKKYQDHQDQELREQKEDTFKNINTQALHHMEEYLSTLEKRFHEVNKQHDLTGKPSYFSLYKMYHEHILSYREAIEIVYITTRHKIEPDNEEEEKQSPDVIAIESVLLSDEFNEHDRQILRDMMEGRL